METFRDLKPGDTITRLISSAKIPMIMTVESVDEDLIHMKGGWTFDRATGVEEDHDLGWGVRFGITGSFLVRDAE